MVYDAGDGGEGNMSRRYKRAENDLKRRASMTPGNRRYRYSLGLNRFTFSEEFKHNMASSKLIRNRYT